jgi:hypothetical protein
MIKFINVSIGNRLDDTNRNEIFVYDDNDTNVQTYLSEIVTLHSNLNEYSDEYIIHITEFIPKNISSDQFYSNKVNSFLTY